MESIKNNAAICGDIGRDRPWPPIRDETQYRKAVRHFWDQMSEKWIFHYLIFSIGLQDSGTRVPTTCSRFSLVRFGGSQFNWAACGFGSSKHTVRRIPQRDGSRYPITDRRTHSVLSLQSEDLSPQKPKTLKSSIVAQKNAVFDSADTNCEPIQGERSVILSGLRFVDFVWFSTNLRPTLKVCRMRTQKTPGNEESGIELDITNCRPFAYSCVLHVIRVSNIIATIFTLAHLKRAHSKFHWHIRRTTSQCIRSDRLETGTKKYWCKTSVAVLTLSLPRAIKFKFLLQPHQKYYQSPLSE